MALGTFIAGRYSSTYASQSLGLMEEGYTLSYSFGLENIDNTDAYGIGTVVEQVYQGANVFCAMTCKEWLSPILAAAQPFGATWTATGTSSFTLGLPGRLASAIAGSLVLSSTANTPAALSPATLTAADAILAENHNVELMFSPKHRKVPLRFRLLPYLVGSATITFFSVT